MSGARTEQPTARRLREARGRGDVAVSREACAVAALGCGLGALAATASGAARYLGAALQGALALRDVAPAAALADAAALLARTAGPPLTAAALGALAAGLLQTRGLFATGALAPRLSRLDPKANLRQLCSGGHAATVALGLARAAVILAVAAATAPPLAAAAPSLARGSAGLAALPTLLSPFAWRLVAAAVALAALDLALVRARHLRALRMTREEVQREHREDEGDPRHRAERRRAHRAVLDSAPVARATCVVVNPTHLAVALLHDRSSDTAPRVLAKGAGEAASRIRGEARRAGVPVVRDVALARALWRLADLGEEIPEELWDATAAVLVHVHGLREDVLAPAAALPRAGGAGMDEGGAG